VSPFPPSFSPRPSLFSENSPLLTATVRCSLSRPLCFHVLVSCPSRTIDLHVLCFQIVTNCLSPKSFPVIVICVARRVGVISFLPNSLCKRLSLSTPLFTYSCGLFVVGRKPNSFAIKQVQLFQQNTRGMGIPDGEHREGNPPARRRVSPSPPHPLYTHTHTSCAAGSKTRNAPGTLASGNADAQQFSGKLSPYFRDWNQDFQSA